MNGSKMNPELTTALFEIPVGNSLGEGIQWNAADGAVWWTDINNNMLYRFEWSNKQLQTFAMPESLCSFAFTQNSNEIIAAFASGFARYNYVTEQITWLARIEADNTNTRLNDGRVDRQGRFWAGTMLKDLQRIDSGAASLYCLQSDMQVVKRRDNVLISNGICWSPDSKTFYFADSPRRAVYAYDFDSDSGIITNQRLFTKTEEGASPDGANVDAKGHLWSAHWGAGRVVQYSPQGDVEFEIKLPVSQPTCVAFGGENLNLLFVTSATEGLDESILKQEPKAGNVFVYQLDTYGLPEPIFKQQNPIN